MDFFSAVADPSQSIIHNERPQGHASDCFAEAIASRFGSGALLTTRLTPVSLAPPPRLAASHTNTMSPITPNIRSPCLPPPPVPTSPTAPLQFSTITPATLRPWTDDPTALILDIRPHVAYSAARVFCAVSLSVPSTLLKRPLFSLHRLADMLPSANARARFSTWRSASRILVYDADSSSIPDSSNIYGLLRKFKNDGFQGDLAWLEGGFQAVWRERRDIIDAQPPTPDAENDEDDEDVAKTSLMQPQSAVLRTRHLPLAAFSFSSTTVNNAPPLKCSTSKRAPLARGVTFPTLPTPSQNSPQPAFNPFFDAVRQNRELSQGITERIPLRLSRRIRHRIHDLPFPWLREIARRAAKLTPRNRSAVEFASSTSEESEDDENITSADVEAGKETLAMQFYKIEVAEQRRLMGIMEHHTKETTIVTSDMGATLPSSFPYSITAGVEKGTKNRYRHIWPFEHARVKLHQRREVDDDYVNASYVQPLGTSKRYIATQGPLPATYTDFWTLCWEQNVHVIVMLTREVENSMVKCGSYWTETEYGPLRLRTISTSETNFPARPVYHRHLTSQKCSNSRHHIHKNEIIQRDFELTHTNYPDAPPRRVIHLQYLEWPDLNVPDDPRGILHLIERMNDAVKEAQEHEDVPPVGPDSAPRDAMSSTLGTEVDEKTGVAKRALGDNCPVLLHCSAGVGRTGGFIAVDSVLDAIRREIRTKVRFDKAKRNEDAMDVDYLSRPTPAPVIVSSIAVEKDDLMSKQEPPVEAVAMTINAGNGHKGPRGTPCCVVHVPAIPAPLSDGTDPEGSGSEKENHFNDSNPSTTNLTKKARVWVEDVSFTDQSITINLPGVSQQRPQQRTSELRSDSPSFKNVQLNVSSDSSSSSNQSLFDFSALNGHSDVATGNHALPLSSSFATSIVTISSPEPSPPRNGPLFHTCKDNLMHSSSSIDHVPIRFTSELLHPLNSTCEDDLEARSRCQPDMGGKDSGLPQQLSGWLGEPVRNRSPSPMTRTASGDSATSPQSRYTKPPFTLRAPPYTGGVSSDAESLSRSVSPSADEGSLANRVSSYHSYLKNHHYQPIHHQSLPISMEKLDKGKSTRNLCVPAPVPERLTPSVTSHTALTGHNPGQAMVVDFKQPRPLHGTATPPLLTCLDEPIYEVVQDMREQRMSLCQSLRQYVFVHAAILEGALMIVDDERRLMKEKEIEQEVEMDGLKIESERRKDARVLLVEEPESGSSDACGNNAKIGESNRQDADPDPRTVGVSAPGPFFGQSDLIPMSTSATCPSSSAIAFRDEGYFTGFVSQPPITLGLSCGDWEGVDESKMESVFSPRPRLPAGTVLSPAVPSLQRPRHAALEACFGRRSTSPSDYIKDKCNDDNGLFKRPSVKRKQPSGEVGEVATRKRAQNKSSSRERERDRQLERCSSNTIHPHSMDGVVDVVVTGCIQ